MPIGILRRLRRHHPVVRRADGEVSMPIGILRRLRRARCGTGTRGTSSFQCPSAFSVDCDLFTPDDIDAFIKVSMPIGILRRLRRHS